VASPIIRTSLAKLNALWYFLRGEPKRPLQGTLVPPVIHYYELVQSEGYCIEETKKYRISPPAI
jgi:hypothetical protein